MLNITNAAAIIIRDKMTGDFAASADILRCPPIVPNLPYLDAWAAPLEFPIGRRHTTTRYATRTEWRGRLTLISVKLRL